MRYAFNVVLAALLATAIAVMLFVGLTTVGKSAEPIKLAPRPPEVRGWVLLHICGLNHNKPADYPDWIYFVPSAILAIGNPTNSPKGCVRITLANASKMYVYGEDYEVAKIVSDALWGPR